jgi:hypothetical protein
MLAATTQLRASLQLKHQMQNLLQLADGCHWLWLQPKSSDTASV